MGANGGGNTICLEPLIESTALFGKTNIVARLTKSKNVGVLMKISLLFLTLQQFLKFCF